MAKITINQTLNTFADANTQSAKTGKIAPGQYNIVSTKNNYPDSTTDYVELFDPNQDKNIWICSRYKTNVYAIIETINQQNTELNSFDNDDFAIDEKAIVDLLPAFYNFTYNLQNPKYPYIINGCNLPQAPPNQNNCCTFVESLIVKAWQNNFKGYLWSNKLHDKMMIASNNDYFSPISCLVEQKIAVNIDNNTIPQPWTVIQGWKNQWRNGHTFIIVAHHIKTDRVLTLESNASYLLNGVGYRMLGPIKQYPTPPANWYNNSSLWTWDKIKSTYKFRAQAQLKIKDLGWVK